MLYVWEICTCLAVFGNIGKSNSPSIEDLTIFPLGYFTIILFGFGRTLLRWENTAMKYLMYPKSSTWVFSLFFYGVFFVVGA